MGLPPIGVKPQIVAASAYSFPASKPETTDGAAVKESIRFLAEC